MIGRFISLMKRGLPSESVSRDVTVYEFIRSFVDDYQGYKCASIPYNHRNSTCNGFGRGPIPCRNTRRWSYSTTLRRPYRNYYPSSLNRRPCRVILNTVDISCNGRHHNECSSNHNNEHQNRPLPVILPRATSRPLINYPKRDLPTNNNTDRNESPIVRTTTR